MMENSPSEPPPADVRMRGFSHRATLQDALSWLDKQLTPLRSQSILATQAAGRVLAQDIISRIDVPGFDRSMMDGFALRASDTLGASAYNPLSLTVIGQALPGTPFAGDVSSGQAVRIMTGAPLPLGADAVLPVEQVEIDDPRIHALGEVSPGKHVGRHGEDIATGATVLRQGRLLRPQDLGVISSIGQKEIEVVSPVRVRIIVTGDELLPPGSKPHGCLIADSNSPMLAAFIQRDGGEPICPGIVADDPDLIHHALTEEADVVLVSGGSSVGQEDHAPALIAQHGELAIHGVAMRPSSPVGMGKIKGRLVFLLPGNPVSCLCAYDFFAGRAIRALGGRSKDWPYRKKSLPLRRKLVSAVGRVDYARVQFVENQVEPLAISGASVLSSTTRADGFVIVPGDSEGYPAGAMVDVFLYD